MPSANLVVDFGAYSTAAAVVVGDQARIVRDPLTNAASWPSHLSLDAGMFYAGSAAERVRLANPRFAVDGPRRAVDSETCSLWATVIWLPPRVCRPSSAPCGPKRVVLCRTGSTGSP